MEKRQGGQPWKMENRKAPKRKDEREREREREREGRGKEFEKGDKRMEFQHKKLVGFNLCFFFFVGKAYMYVYVIYVTAYVDA